MTIAYPNASSNGSNPHTSKQPSAANVVSFSSARLKKPFSELLLRYDQVPSLEKEKKQFQQYCQVDLAHLVMLHEQGIVEANAVRKLLPLLEELRVLGVDQMQIDPLKGSLLLQIETHLAGQLGEEVAGRVHTARSRIDHGATCRRLYYRERHLAILGKLNHLRRTAQLLAQKHIGTIMPVYTHMQIAQPASFGHHILSFESRLKDDFERGVSVYSRLNRSPLGCVGFSGTSWPIDRERTAELLGFGDLVANSRAARDEHFAVEISANLGLIMSTLNDLATDFHIWSSGEFGFISLDDGYCSTSSIFPQKKNPIALETIKLLSGSAVNWASSALATFRGEGTGDQRIRVVSSMDTSFDTTEGMLELAAGILETVQVNSARMHSSLTGAWSTASNLADVLVKQTGISFREAHHVVARLVRLCEESGVPREEASIDLLKSASAQTIEHNLTGFQEADLHLALDLRTFIATRSSLGSPGPAPTQKLLASSKESIAEDEAWLTVVQRNIAISEEKLASAIRMILNAA